MSPGETSQGEDEALLPSFPADDLVVLARELAQLRFHRAEIDWCDFRVTIARRSADEAAEIEPPSNGGDAIVTATIAGSFVFAGAAQIVAGVRLTEGDVIGAIEVLDVMNPIGCARAGVVAEVFVRTGDFVEYGQPLLRLEPL